MRVLPLCAKAFPLGGLDAKGLRTFTYGLAMMWAAGAWVGARSGSVRLETMAAIKLERLPDRTPVKIAILVSPELNRALADYAAAYEAATARRRPWRSSFRRCWKHFWRAIAHSRECAGEAPRAFCAQADFSGHSRRSGEKSAKRRVTKVVTAGAVEGSSWW